MLPTYVFTEKSGEIDLGFAISRCSFFCTLLRERGLLFVYRGSSPESAMNEFMTCKSNENDEYGMGH